MADLAKRVVALTASRSAIVVEGRPQDDPHRRRPDIARARERLGWSPTVPLDEGLRRTIDDFRSRRAGVATSGAEPVNVARA